MRSIFFVEIVQVMPLSANNSHLILCIQLISSPCQDIANRLDAAMLPSGEGLVPDQMGRLEGVSDVQAVAKEYGTPVSTDYRFDSRLDSSSTPESNTRLEELASADSVVNDVIVHEDAMLPPESGEFDMNSFYLHLSLKQLTHQLSFFPPTNNK